MSFFPAPCPAGTKMIRRGKLFAHCGTLGRDKYLIERRNGANPTTRSFVLAELMYFYDPICHSRLS